MKYTLKIMVMLLLVTLSGVAIGTGLGVNPLWVIGILLASALVPRQLGILTVSLVDLSRPTGSNPGAGGGVKSEIILIPNSDIDWSTFPAKAADGVTVSNIPMKAGKYMKRFYMTADVIEPSMKKIKGGNKDSGGYEVSLKGFHPGWGDAIMSWIALYGYAFEGLVIIQNCADGKKYLIGEACNLVYCDDIQSAWGATVEKEKGNTFTFVSKMKTPVGIYTGAIKYDPTSASW